jgi:hypothetical protein
MQWSKHFDREAIVLAGHQFSLACSAQPLDGADVILHSVEYGRSHLAE